MKIKKILAATLALSLAVSAPFSNHAIVSKVSAASKPAQVKNVTFKIKNNKGIVSYKKVTGVSGYQIVLANNKTFTKGKKVVKTKQTKKTLTISAKKTTFLKVRAYKQTKKETVYGAFSKIVESLMTARNQIEKIDDKLKRKKKLLNMKDSYTSDVNLVNQVGQLLVDSVQSKISVLSKICEK